ncbi:LOW QUALITY PROTEIN: cytosolic sulfotransferase 14-like [Diospyros lotus]|uniref:LOW QUALITY PROTEIN: cytosolic sulfotransferase 14-like n=1 Tax=Diospyros lotus TaxID=55363 RepID=UPI00225154E5|nr:LOW QUALITY PROTEIN: cytosolic sulfotransferase 14-like [Diospyros lotus]
MAEEGQNQWISRRSSHNFLSLIDHPNINRLHKTEGRSRFFPLSRAESRIAENVVSCQQHFQAHETDTILASFPKCGTTWLKALIFAVANRSKHPLIESPLLSTSPHAFVPSLEFQIYRKPPLFNLQDIPSPRILSTHLPYSALPASIKTNSQYKLIYIYRNIPWTSSSPWHFASSLQSKNHYSISLDEWSKKYCISGITPFGPFWDHMLLGYWKASQEKPGQVLFLKYEELKEDDVFYVKKLAEFLGVPFSMEEERDGMPEQISRLCSFENLKDLEVNKSGKIDDQSLFHNKQYFRKAKVGDWSNYLSSSVAEALKKLMHDTPEGSGLTFKTS